MEDFYGKKIRKNQKLQYINMQYYAVDIIESIELCIITSLVEYILGDLYNLSIIATTTYITYIIV